MKGFEEPFFEESADIESVESVPIFQFTFYNNHQELFTIATPNDEIPYELFRSKYLEKFGVDRAFGSEDGDSFSRLEAKAFITD
jgi:hypothetical protein